MYRNRDTIRGGSWEANGQTSVSAARGEVLMRLRRTAAATGVPAGQTEHRATVEKFSEQFMALPAVVAHRKQLERLAAVAKDHQAAVDLRDSFRDQYGSPLNNDESIDTVAFADAERRAAQLAIQVQSLQENIAEERARLGDELKAMCQQFSIAQIEECTAIADSAVAELLKLASPLLDRLADVADRRDAALSESLPSIEKLLGPVPDAKLQPVPIDKPAQSSRAPFGHSNALAMPVA